MVGVDEWWVWMGGGCGWRKELVIKRSCEDEMKRVLGELWGKRTGWKMGV